MTRDTNSYIADRGEAVNLARTVLEQPGGPEITNKGIEKLARAVLDMDDWISLHNGPNCSEQTVSESGAIDYKRGYEYLQDRLESIGYHGWAHDMDEEIRRTQSATASIADNLPLICKAIGGHLDMRIGEKTLAFATLHCPALWDADADRGRFRVTNPAEFAKAVGHELNKEAEDGSTRLTRMLDGAIQEAINQGAEGIEEIDALDSRSKSA